MDLLYKLAASVRKRSRDWGVIALALFLAAGIWLITNLSREYETVLSVNVIASSSLEGRSATSADRAVIQARCRASGFRIRDLRREARKGARTVVFQPGDLHPVEGTEDSFAISAAQLDRYVPQLYGAHVRLETFITDEAVFRFPVENHKRVPVVPVRDIRFRPQYMEQSPLTVYPDSVTVYGDPLLLERVTQVRTQPIRLDDVSSSIQDVIRLYPIQGVRFSEETVKYTLSVTRFVEMSYERRIEVEGAPKGLSFACYPGVARVTLLSVFPILWDPNESLRLKVDYADFRESLTGDCVPVLSVAGEEENLRRRGIISSRIEPEVVHVVEVQE